MPVSGKCLAEQLDCSRRYLESDLQKLAQAGLLESRRGAHGGYVLARSPHRISLEDVVACLGSETACETACDCQIQDKIVAPQFAKAKQTISKALAEISLAEALQQASASDLLQLPASPTDFSI